MVHFFTDSKQNRIGLIHHIFRGDETVSFTEDKKGSPYVNKKDREKVIQKFEDLEQLAYEYIYTLSEEFEDWLDSNGFESGMGTIDYKRKKNT